MKECVILFSKVSVFKTQRFDNWEFVQERKQSVLYHFYNTYRLCGIISSKIKPNFYDNYRLYGIISSIIKPTKRKLKVLSPNVRKEMCICSLPKHLQWCKGGKADSFLYLCSDSEQKCSFMDSVKFFMSPHLRKFIVLLSYINWRLFS